MDGWVDGWIVGWMDAEDCRIRTFLNVVDQWVTHSHVNSTT